MAIVLPARRGSLAGLQETLLPLLQKIQADKERKQNANDLSSVVNFLSNKDARTQLPGGQQGPVRGVPQVGSPFAQQALIQGLQQERSQEATARQALAVQQAKTSQTSSVIQDPDDPNNAIRVRNVFDTQGNLVSQVKIGDATLPEKVGGVDPESFTGLQKPVAAKIQTDVKDATIDIANLEAVRDSFRDEFTEIPFKIGAKITAAQESAGGFLGEASPERKQALADFSTWKKAATKEFVVFKKWATGVAAGQKEMSQQIEAAFASPRNDSATEFKSKIDNSILVRKRTLEILNSFLESGSITTEQGKQEAMKESFRQALIENEEGVIRDNSAPTQQPEEQQPENLTESLLNETQGLRPQEQTQPSRSNILGGNQQAEQQIVTPTSQAEYDAIPKGTIFVDEDGIKKRKL